MRRLILSIAMFFTVASACAQGMTRSIRLDPSDPKRTNFGELTFLGGVEWRADRGDFGGFSGLLLDPDGTITALTDKAHWFKATLVLDESDRLAGITGLEVGRLYGSDGTYLQRPYMDSEAIARDGDGYLIAFERAHRISRFAELKAPEQAVPGLPDLNRLGPNRGIEAMVRFPDGRLVIVAEEPPSFGDHIGWIVDDNGARAFSIVRRGGYSPTDLALGPDGEMLYLLERRYSLLGGPGMHIRRFPLDTLAPGAMVTGETLIDIGAAFAIDNMEAIAAWRGKGGATELFVLSDDNFSARQRTILLHFRVNEAD